MEDGHLGEIGMKAKDGSGKNRLPVPRRAGHGAEDDAGSDEHLRIPLKTPIRKGRHLEEIFCFDPVSVAATDAGSEHEPQLLRVGMLQSRLEPGRHFGGQELGEPGSGVLVFQRFGEELRRFDHFHFEKVQGTPKKRVLLAGPIPEQDVVEEELVHGGGHHVVHFEAGLVEQHLAQAADFGTDLDHELSMG